MKRTASEPREAISSQPSGGASSRPRCTREWR
jgi:hypothetical protein